MNFSYDGGFVHWNDTEASRVYIHREGGLRPEAIEMFHDGSQLGKDNVYNSLSRHAYWHRMYEDVSKYLASCGECEKNEVLRENVSGKLQPLYAAGVCWEESTADFASKFPMSPRGHDMVPVMVERLSK